MNERHRPGRDYYTYNKNSVLTKLFPEGTKGFLLLQRYRLLVVKDILGYDQDSHENLERFEKKYRARIQARQTPDGYYLGASVGRCVYDELQRYNSGELERIMLTLERPRMTARPGEFKNKVI